MLLMISSFGNSNMKLGISNLAWNTNEEFENIIPSLKENDIKYIEITFSKHLEWNNPNHKLDSFINILKKNNLKTVSTQSIFFNTNVNSFYDDKFIKHLELICTLSKEIGVDRLVLGSPNMRIDKNYNKLIEVFTEVNKLMIDKNITLLLEPNCRAYAGEFFHTVSEIVGFIKAGGYENIKTMIDTHNILLENQNPFTIFNQYKEYINHVHVSEVNLKGFIESDEHNKLADTLRENKYDGVIVYEVKPSSNILNDIKLFSKTYNK